jgi:predicted nucleotidyltransferase
MAYLVQDKIGPLGELCRRYGVRKLALFGSALRDDFDPKRSDLDFVVEFAPQPSGGYANAYFGLLRDMETLLGCPVDLIESGTIRNPYIRRSVEADQKTLYAA